VIHLGTSGFTYAHWKYRFYPAGLPAREWLAYYSTVFSTVELNATFYRLPSEEAVDGWRDRSPRGFLFACKGSRFLTHLKRLTDTGEGVELFFSRVFRLGAKLGPVLWQLPPQMSKVDLPRLEAFLSALPTQVQHAVEFRAAAWHSDEVAALLDRHGAAFVEHDLVDRPVPAVTGGVRYLRFHGTTSKYHGRYGARALAPFARSLRDFGGESFVYFNNDLQGHALLDALDLAALLEGSPLAPVHTLPA
jgi:uncharacterized protein YecE (DUF72 family)